MEQPGHGGNVWLAEQIYRIKKEHIIDFSANINPLGPSPRALTAIQQALPSIKHYPDPEAGGLRAAISHTIGLPEEHLIMGNGAAELIYALGRVLRTRRVLLPVPTFSEYAGGLAGVDLVPVPLDRECDFNLQVSNIARLLQSGDLVIICNPNNPTGQLVPGDQLRWLLRRARELGAWLMVDEAFMDFVQPEQSLLPDIPRHSNLIIVRSLTKFYALPGLRLGYLAAAPDMVQRLTDILPPWRVNTLAQAAGLASLADQAYQTSTRQIITAQREFLTRGLAQIPGLRPLPAAANFILVDCRDSGYQDRQIQNYLGPRGILIRPCHNFAGLSHNYFRVAVRLAHENEVLLQHLRELLA